MDNFLDNFSIEANYPLQHLTWFKVGGCAELMFRPKNLEDLINFLRQNHLQHQTLQSAGSITVIGAGSNIIIRDGGIRGTVIKLGRNFTDICLREDNLLEVGAGCLNFNLSKFCQTKNIKNFEFLAGIPGCAGGGVVMNAGAYGKQFQDLVYSIETVDFKGNLHHIAVDDINFSYRNSNLPKDLIITKVIFKAEPGKRDEIDHLMLDIVTRRKATQPVAEKTSGSSFTNPSHHKAWELIDKAGLRGYKIGGARVSELHCNFIINDGTATATDIENLGEFIRSTVLQKTGILLEWEIKRIGEHKNSTN